jgi:L-aspartate oxidase
MEADGTDHVLLDMRQLSEERFPNVYEALRAAGFDPAGEPIPVSPASHYVMGGIATDLEGRSALPGLFAVGECACTGLHGANRLASNSLSECFVFGYRAGFAALGEPAPGPDVLEPTDAVAGPPSRETRRAMWEHAGLERDATTLAPLLHDPHPLARLVARCAIAREETRGAHSRSDFPATDPNLDRRHTVLKAADEEPHFVFWP